MLIEIFNKSNFQIKVSADFVNKNIIYLHLIKTKLNNMGRKFISGNC